MASLNHLVLLVASFLAEVNSIDIYHKRIISAATTTSLNNDAVITINGMFLGLLNSATANDVVHVNELLLFTRNGIQQRLNSWQDGVSGTNCPIKPGTNWAYVFQTQDQISTFTYLQSINFHKAAGGFGPIRVNNRNVIAVALSKSKVEFEG